MRKQSKIIQGSADARYSDLDASFFVGDAAGRQYKNKKPDFSSTDRKLALNIGISFKTPEVGEPVILLLILISKYELGVFLQPFSQHELHFARVPCFITFRP